MPKGKAKPRVVKASFSVQVASDYPQSIFAAEGSKMYGSLLRRKRERKKLDKYEEYLVLPHFPKKQKTYNKEQKTAEEMMLNRSLLKRLRKRARNNVLNNKSSYSTVIPRQGPKVS
jgi:hypothetical protein